MKLINLDTLKIEDSGEKPVLVKTVILHGLNKNKGIKSFFNEIREELSDQINWENGVKNTSDTVYFDIVYDGKISAAEDEDDIRYIINIIIGAFVEEMIDGENRVGRSREHRLGVPESFKGLYLSVMNIKKLINYKTKVDKFILNIRASGNEFIYNAIGNEEGESIDDAA